jgi:hypothetical protein
MRVLAAVAVLAATSTAHARGGAIFIPPAEVDLGIGSPVGGATTGPSHDILAGIHWASLYWHPTHVDIGLGFVGSYRDVLPGYTLRATSDVNDNVLALDGAYLSLGYTLESRKHFRTWLDARIETLHGSLDDQSFNALGSALRISTELYVSGAVGGGSGGGFVAVAGTWALGVYVEGSHRDIAPELGPNNVSIGVSMRVPLILAAAN